MLTLTVDGEPVVVLDESVSLLEVLREQLHCRSVKDGCSPQGQCGCCTVLVDGQPRVACVTPVRRVAGRSVTTAAGLADRDRWADAFCATGASQCGFCTPGIIVRFAGLAADGAGPDDLDKAGRALLAHLCRCTGWRPVLDAWQAYFDPDRALLSAAATSTDSGRDLHAAAQRAALEGGVAQSVGPEVALGGGGFAEDTAPEGALVAVPDGDGWALGSSVAAARRVAGKVQGRRTTAEAVPPLDLPEGEWAFTLRTCWVEPAYLETDASWCEPGGSPASSAGNGGAFGGKAGAEVEAVAARLAAEQGRAVRVVLAREDVVRRSPKRPPVAAGVRADGTGVLRVARTPGIAEAVARVAPGLVVEEVALAGPPTSVALRAAGWAEAWLLLAALSGSTQIRTLEGAVVDSRIDGGALHVRVDAGEPLDEVVLRSYCTGAAHMALSWITSEALAVDAAGVPLDLTIRSFGVLRAVDMPEVHVEIVAGNGTPLPVSDAVFASVAATVWLAQGCPPDLPTRRPLT